MGFCREYIIIRNQIVYLIHVALTFILCMGYDKHAVGKQACLFSKIMTGQGNSKTFPYS